MLTLGERIKHIRKTNQLNQVEFAKIIGVSQGTLSEFEQDKYKPSIDTIISIHNNFKVDIEWLIVDTSLKDAHLKNSYKIQVGDKEKKLISAFRKLSIADQDETMEIIKLKLKKYMN